VYQAAGGSELELFLGYFERQEQGRELVGFGLSRVIPARAANANPASDSRFRDGLLTSDNGKTHHVTYSYLVDGRVTTEWYETKFWTTFNSIAIGRSNGGIVVVSRVLASNESIDDSRQKVHRFLGELMRASTAYFPQR
jgi:hypothetical protein